MGAGLQNPLQDNKHNGHTVAYKTDIEFGGTVASTINE